MLRGVALRSGLVSVGSGAAMLPIREIRCLLLRAGVTG